MAVKHKCKSCGSVHYKCISCGFEDYGQCLLCDANGRLLLCEGHKKGKHRKREKAMSNICMDCSSPFKLNAKISLRSGLCEHWTPEYWEAQGFKRDWGDAAIMEPGFEALRRERKVGIETVVEYIVLCPTFLRRPVMYFASGENINSWGSY